MPNALTVFSLAMLMLNLSAKPEQRPASTTKKVVIEASPVIYLGSKEENEEVIPWKYERMLTWEDFQCEPKRGTDVVATTSTTLGISYQLIDGQLSYSITCNFSKLKSWGSMRTGYILAHEQGHFDITELMARKLHADLQAYVVNKKTFRQDIARIYQAAVQEKERMQESYDRETDHSRNKQRQYEWLDYIERLLLESEPLETYP
jgi:predicted secreted Zn-dependent protease